MISGSTAGFIGSAGGDHVVNAGLIRGLVNMGAGADIYDGRGGQVAGQISGGRGDDNIRGGASDDHLFGNSDKDALRGGAGGDILVGGRGMDALTGGRGADVFVFEQVTHSSNNQRADVITDFALGQDLIDLSQLIAGEFTFLGTDRFTATGAEVRAVNHGNDTWIRVDLDGDGNADMKIVISEVTGILEGDFLL